MKSTVAIELFALLCLSLNVYADPETDKAIDEVQLQMQNSNFQDKAKGNSKEAPEVIKNVKLISGSSENEQEMYKLAAEVLGNFKGKSAEEIQKILEGAKANPEAFANSLTTEQKEKLKDLSERLPAANTKKP